MAGSDAFMTATDAAPSLIGAFFRVGLAVVVLAAIAGVWLYWNRKVKGPRRHLEVLDRAFLARGASVTLLRVEGRRLLVGVSPEGVRLIARVGDADGAEADDPPELESAVAGGFAAVLGRARSRREAREC